MFILKKVTFWFVLLSIMICLFHYFGLDSEGWLISIFTMEPIWYKAIYTEPFRSWMLTANFEIRWFGYLLRMFTFIFYGVILDLIITLLKKLLIKFK